MPSDDRNVVVSISGLVLSLSRKQLNKYPHTRLAQQFLHGKSTYSTTHTLISNDASSRENAGQRPASETGDGQVQPTSSRLNNVVVYYFNRNPFLFVHIVDFYRTGMLHFPHQHCWTAIADELDYWRIDCSFLAHCCQKIYSDHKRRVDSFREMQAIFGDDVRRFQTALISTDTPRGRFSHFQKTVSQFYNDSASTKSPRVKAYLLTYIFVVLVYLFSYILQSEMAFREIRPHDDEAFCPQYKVWLNASYRSGIDNYQRTPNISLANGPKYAKYFISTPKLTFKIMDGFCTFVFCVDLILRYMGSVNARTFFTDAGHIMDCLCNVSDVIALALHMTQNTNFSCSVGVLVIYLLVEISRVLRVMRLIQFTNRYNGIIVLIFTLRASMRELLLLMSVLGAGVVVFGFLIYVAELSDSSNSKYNNFMIGFWWSIVTMTTLGYGDIRPTTPFGYLIGSACAITGVIFVALQVPVIANKFNILYSYACDQLSREQWAREEAFETGEVSMPMGRHKMLTYKQPDNPVVEFKCQLERIPAYSTPASQIFSPN